MSTHIPLLVVTCLIMVLRRMGTYGHKPNCKTILFSQQLSCMWGIIRLSFKCNIVGGIMNIVVENFIVN